jgi:hypothetical protein
VGLNLKKGVFKVEKKVVFKFKSTMGSSIDKCFYFYNFSSIMEA